LSRIPRFATGGKGKDDPADDVQPKPTGGGAFRQT